MRFASGLLVVAALALVTGTAVADVPSAPPGPAPAVTHHRFLSPVVLGIIAATFLVFGAVVGANDRPKGDKKS